MNENKNYFKDLNEMNVNEHVERKGKFSYLSWAWAVKSLREYDPTATWETIRFEGIPYLKTELGYFVEVAVTVQGITLSQIHPVLDNSNRPIAVPNPFHINTSIQRALVKAIALHGLGLYIYAGEDLPDAEKDTSGQKETPTETPKFVSSSPAFAKTPQVNFVKSLIKGHMDKGITKEVLFKELNELFGFTSFETLTTAQASKIIDHLKK